MERLSRDASLKLLLYSYGYDIMDVTWEDTARNKNSCYGSNISDMTLNYVSKDKEIKMPVIRKHRFVDLTTDISIDKFTCPVGNEIAALYGV